MKKFAFILSIGMLSTSYTQDWFQVESGTLKDLNVIDFPSNQIGYIGGEDSLLLKTIDGGKTWEELNYSGVTFIESGGFDDAIINLKFVTPEIGYMAVGPYSNGIYKTIDGGLNWNLVAPMVDDLCFNFGLYFFAEDDGFLGGADCFTGEQIHRITASGTSPTTIVDLPISAAMTTSIDFLDSEYGLALGGFSTGGAVIKTIDGGVTWDAIPTEFEASITLNEIVIVNDTLAYIAYENGDASYGLLESTDAGETWHYHAETTTFYYPRFRAIHLAANGQIFAAGSTALEPHGVIFSSMLSEIWWNNWPLEQPIESISSYNDLVVWAVGDSGYIVVNINPETLSIAENTIDQFDFKISPNPTETQLKISGIHPDEIANVFVQNYMGEIIFNGNTLMLDVHHLSNGIYFLTIQLKSGEQTTQKFVKN